MELKIYTEQMKEGKTESFSGKVATAAFLAKEPELTFADELNLSGEAYLAGDHLIIKLQADVSAWIPCAICNEPTETLLTLKDFYHAEPLENISSGIFDFSSVLRDDLLLAIPQFTECQGNCPARESIKKYLKKPTSTSSSHNAQFPFSDLS